MTMDTASTPRRPLRLGVIGLGRAFVLMLPTLRAHPLLCLVAAMDPRPEARDRFVAEFGGRAHETVEALCADPEVDAIYVASPHSFHREQVIAALEAGRHVLVEKPMALDLASCEAMVEAAERAGVHLVVGHSHSFDAPVLHARRAIEAGKHGRLRMITAMNFTDFLYRPRRPEELDTALGGGVVWSQAAHQVDVVRLLGGGLVKSVRATAAVWDPSRRSESAYNALLTFADGASATMTYSGAGHFDTDELCGWIGELGQRRDAADYGGARARLAGRSEADEIALKAARTYGAGAGGSETPPVAHNHFGFVVASCDHADLRPTAEGVLVYGDHERRFEALPVPEVPRTEVIDELRAAVIEGVPPIHDGAWGMATLEVCGAILQSAAEDREVVLHHQVVPGDRR
jgi:phthalate 4,5-cis-dihydrodiol dehydrogenase